LLVAAFLFGAITAFWAYSFVGTEMLLLAAVGIAGWNFTVASRRR
jgi:hypothetical protein